MMRLLKSVLACFRNHGQHPSQAGGEPRLGWKGNPVGECCRESPADYRFDTLISTRPRRARLKLLSKQSES
jgi:hypothetical protein